VSDSVSDMSASADCGVEAGSGRQDPVGCQQRRDHLVMEVEDEQEEERGERDDGRERRLRLALLDGRRHAAAIADHHGDGRSHELEGEQVDPGEQADQHADRQFADQGSGDHVGGPLGVGRELVPAVRQDRHRHGDRDEQADLHRHADRSTGPASP
jgi:hypothetical protein